MNFLSVIVPTKNRSATLKHCLRTILAQETNVPYEIIVSDNRSEDDTQDVVRSFNDERIKLVQPPSRLGMTEHWEWALRQSSGEWVTIVGDDDALMPSAVETIYSVSSEYDVRAISSQRHSFVWPIEGQRSVLKVRGGKGFSTHNTKKNLHLVLMGRLSHKNLPWIYTGGFVKREAIMEVMKIRGTFFKSISPDLCSAMSLSLLEDKYLYLHEPVSIGGTSGFSNGRATMLCGNKNKILEEFYEESSIKFLPELGDGHVQSLPLITFEAFKVNAGDFENVVADTDLTYQLALTMLKSKKEFEANVKQYCRDVAGKNNIQWSSVMLMFCVMRYWAPLMTRLARTSHVSEFSAKRSGVKVFRGVSDNIYDASREALSKSRELSQQS